MINKSLDVVKIKVEKAKGIISNFSINEITCDSRFLGIIHEHAKTLADIQSEEKLETIMLEILKCIKCELDFGIIFDLSAHDYAVDEEISVGKAHAKLVYHTMYVIIGKVWRI